MCCVKSWRSRASAPISRTGQMPPPVHLHPEGLTVVRTGASAASLPVSTQPEPGGACHPAAGPVGVATAETGSHTPLHSQPRADLVGGTDLRQRPLSHVRRRPAPGPPQRGRRRLLADVLLERRDPRVAQAEGFRATLGGQQLVRLLTTQQTRDRCQAWLTMRDEIGLPLGLAVTRD